MRKHIMIATLAAYCVVTTMTACSGGSNTAATTDALSSAGQGTSSISSSSSQSTSSVSSSSVTSSSSTSSTSSISTSSSTSSSTTSIAINRPTGIFVLDSPQGTYRDGNIRNYDFVSGYAWRYGWYLMEPAEDSYDFTALDHILAKVSEQHQKLSWIIMPTQAGVTEPPYVLAQAITWTDKSNMTFPVPWDSYVLARYKKFLETVASHQVADPAQGGLLVPIPNHSALYAINITFPGVPNLAIRDKRDNIVDIPGYTRAAFQDAIIATLHVVRNSFPKQYIHFGFWQFTDDAESGEAWQALRDRVLSEFGSSVGFYMDNLAASRTCATCNPITGSPTTDFAAPMTTSTNNTYTAFQALTSWTNPTPTYAAKVLNGTPMDGIDYGLTAFNSHYVELYIDDVDRADWHTNLKASATILTQ